MAIQLNPKAISRGRSLIQQGKIDHGAWDESAVERTKANSLAFAAIDTEQDEANEAHWKFPFISGGKVNARAVGSGIAYAKKSGYVAVAGALQGLSDMIAKKTASATSRKTAKKTAMLRNFSPAVYSDAALSVDADGGIIKNAAMMTCGKALGHGFVIDSTTLAMMKSLADAQEPEGVKCRFGHPAMETGINDAGEQFQYPADDIGRGIARIHNFRIDGDCLRADIHLGAYSAMVPGLGDVRSYLIAHASDDPAGIGMSAFFVHNLEPLLDDSENVDSLLSRPVELTAFDVVGTPAANPNGLLNQRMFDPQPPSGTPDSSGWSDEAPADPPAAPLPVSTPEFPRDERGDYLRALVKDGPMSLGGIAARFNGRLEAMRAGLDWLVSNGYANKSGARITKYAATPKGITQAALAWK